MAKKIIILGASISGVNINVNCVFWYPITSGALALASGSVWPGASTAENTAIQNGSVLEQQLTLSFPVGTPSASIEALLLLQWTNTNGQLGGKGPAQFAGVFNDSVSGWSA
jgi:hypothetical protein